MGSNTNSTEQLKLTIDRNYSHNIDFLFLEHTVTEVELTTKELHYKLVKQKDSDTVTIYPLNNSGYFKLSKYNITYINNGITYFLYNDKNVRYIKKRAMYNKKEFFTKYIDHAEDVIVENSLKKLTYVKRDVAFIYEFYLLLISSRQAIIESLALTYKRED